MHKQYHAVPNAVYHIEPVVFPTLVELAAPLYTRELRFQ